MVVFDGRSLPRKSETSVKIGKKQPINRPLIQWGEAFRHSFRSFRSPSCLVGNSRLQAGDSASDSLGTSGRCNRQGFLVGLYPAVVISWVHYYVRSTDSSPLSTSETPGPSPAAPRAPGLRPGLLGQSQWVSFWSSQGLPGPFLEEYRKKEKLLGVTLFETRT